MNQYWNTQDELRALCSELKELRRQLELVLSANTEMRSILTVTLDIYERDKLDG